MPDTKTNTKPDMDIVANVAEKVRGAENVLVALSKNPNVDELSAAIGLTLLLDKMGKHATAIFSGVMPNMLEFLDPQKTIETNTDSLQDFIIALNKEKADHLRYKIDGDYVKVFITPYRTTLNESDLEFSHGDFNVDLVIALDVATAADLDGALFEHGRIMHNASAVNITVGPAGNFCDIEWMDPLSSSVSELVARLPEALNSKEEMLDKSIATALLTGIVAATNRFSNEKTTSDTMAAAAKLMGAGADQQLIAANIPTDICPPAAVAAAAPVAPAAPVDPTSLAIDHGAAAAEVPVAEVPVALPEQQLEQAVAAPPAEVSGPLMDDLKQVAAEVAASVGEPVPSSEPVALPTPEEVPAAAVENPEMVVPVPEEPVEEAPKDYASMMEKELAEPLPYEIAEQQAANPAAENAPEAPGGPEANSVPQIDYTGEPTASAEENKVPPMMGEEYLTEKHESVLQPTGNLVVDENGMPIVTENVINMETGEVMAPPPAASPLPMPDGAMLPPPPPPFDPGQAPSGAVEYVPAPVPAPAAIPAAMPEVAALPDVEPIRPAAPITPPELVGATPGQPAMQDQVYPAAANDPGAFKIPGM